MELRTALFIIGLVVILFIAYVSFYRSQQQTYRLPKKMRRFSRKDDDAVDPLFEPRKGPGKEASVYEEIEHAEKEASQAKEPVEKFARRDTEVEPAPLARDEIENPSPTMQLDLQPAEKKRDHGPEKAIEYIALIQGKEPITRDRVLGVYRQHEYRMEKQNGIFGFNIANGLWRDMEQEEQSAEFRDICLTIQLVDQDGPVSESELHRFSQMGLEVAEELERPILFSMDFDEAIAYARDLDLFRKEMDIILVVSLVARSDKGLKLQSIHREAKKLGLVYSTDKIYQRIRLNSDNRTEVLFSMANMFKPGELPMDEEEMHTSGLTFFMRFVAVPNPVDVYVDMINTATTLGKRLNCILVDQETRPINESMTVSQTKSISNMTGRMDARHIPAGSELAKRLF